MPPELDVLRQLNFQDAVELLRPAMIFTVGVAIYAIIIFNLYRFMSRKNIFNLDFSKYEESGHPALRKILHLIFYLAKYLLIFPLFAFFWFGVLVVMVAFLSKTKEVERPAAHRHGGADLGAGNLLLHRGPVSGHCQNASLRPAGHLPDRPQILRSWLLYGTAETRWQTNGGAFSTIGCSSSCWNWSFGLPSRTSRPCTMPLRTHADNRKTLSASYDPEPDVEEEPDSAPPRVRPLTQVRRQTDADS